MNEKKAVVITGVTRGLGRAMAEELARLGHTVVGCGRSQKEIAVLRTQLGDPHNFSAVNVAVGDEVKAWVMEVVGRHSAAELLLNNAAVINKNARLWEVGPEEFAQVIDVNVKGTVSVIRHFLPTMIEHGHGVVVNFSSGWGRSTDAEVGPYCASKWAIEGLTQSLS